MSNVVGAQEPRVRVVPPYVSSAGAEAIEVAGVAGLHLDPWEQLVLTDALGETAASRWAAYRVGLVAPRQNGKGSVLEARELAGLFAFGERLIIHSAHEQATATEHFNRLLALMEGVPEFDRRILKAVRGKGTEAIILRDGYRIFFKTRTGGGGRGFTGDLVVFDEAMILAAAFMAALVPTMAARSIDGDPQLWFAGSAVDRQKTDHGIEFSRVRADALKGVERLAYFDWSIPGDNPELVPPEVLDDPEMWAQANPGLGIRISPEYVSDERKALGAREFAVERLGVGDWPDPDDLDGRVFLPGQWNALRDPASSPLDPVAFGFAVRPDRSTSAIAVAGRRADGLEHVEIVQRATGTGWVADRIATLIERWPTIGVYANGVGAGASLTSELGDHGIEVTPATAGEYAGACGQFFDAVDQSTLRHLGTDDLGAAVDGARKRPLGERWAWSHKDSEADITALEAATLALWGLETQQPAVDLAANIW